MKSLARIGLAVSLVALVALALWPIADRLLAVHAMRAEVQSLQNRPLRVRSSGQGERPFLPVRSDPPLASWGNIGGCGAGGGSASTPGGAIRWVGRNVTGGLLDVQCMTSETQAHGNSFAAASTRLGMSPANRWGTALYVPVLYKVGDVSVLGQSKTARIAGFGDLSLEVSRKLGATETHMVTLIGSVPTGSHDAVRQGIVLPQHLQLGAGVPGITAQYQHTRDRDWGLLLFGGTVSYNGWKNDIGDQRAPSATANTHLGYILGRFVPSAGLTLFGKAGRDRERGADRPASSDPLLMAIPSLGLEWSSDWVAVMAATTVGLSVNGLESTTVGLGISSSLF